MKFSQAVLLTVIVLFVIVLVMVYPESALDAAVNGIAIWWEVLFPALLPFLVLAEIMLGFGVVHFIGTLLDPFMRPLFRVPGTGGFVMAMGFASGYPMAAKLVSQLRANRLISRFEGERLVAFSTTADPIFLIGAVSVGFFHSQTLAPILLLSHYGAAIIVGLCMRFYGNNEYAPSYEHRGVKPNGIKAAILAMHTARIANPIPIGKLLTRAIQSALEIILLLGGLVIFISVVIEMLTASGLMQYLYSGMESLLALLHLPAGITQPFIDGVFEVTLGAKAAAETDEIGILIQVVMACLIVSWGGLSVHAQIVGLLSHTDLRYKPFLLARFLHGVFAAVLAFIIFQYIVL